MVQRRGMHNTAHSGIYPRSLQSLSPAPSSVVGPASVSSQHIKGQAGTRRTLLEHVTCGIFFQVFLSCGLPGHHVWTASSATLNLLPSLLENDQIRALCPGG